METDAFPRVTRASRAAQLHGPYAILDEKPDVAQRAAALLAAGVRIVQYRPKDAFRAQTLRRLRELTRERDAILILNDDWRRAVEFDCDGVHLGPQDDGFTGPSTVRAALEERLIGLSCGTAAEVERAGASDVDYLGIGSVFTTASKADAGAPIGLDGLRALTARTRLPVAAIGGIGEEHIQAVRATGVAMAAVLSALAGPGAGDVAARLVRAWSARG
ncbi:MAG TPA: thiamine phosphate synthase [Candidatus Cybelea sp.]|nr:thiamine phosphate synthase [Candidatus Cybelea sp.]